MPTKRSTRYDKTTLGLAFGLCLFVGASPAWSDDEGQARQAAGQSTASSEKAPASESKPDAERLTTETTASANPRSTGPLYVLPKVGKPRGRVGGGRRSAAAELPDVYALVPDHVGQTVSEQPTLYWYLSADAPATVKFELTLLDEESIDPLVDAKIESPARSGLQRVVLEEHGIRLRPGEEYQWSVAIVSDDENRSEDVVSSGWVERVAQSDELGAAASTASGAERVRIFAQAGLWYDALDAAYLQMNQNPDDPQARAQFEQLLAETQLPHPQLGAVIREMKPAQAGRGRTTTLWPGVSPEASRRTSRVGKVNR